MPIKIKVEGKWYDVTNFDHPGDGIRGVCLRYHDGEDVTEQMENYHQTNEPFDILLEADENGECRGIMSLPETSDRPQNQK